MGLYLRTMRERDPKPSPLRQVAPYALLVGLIFFLVLGLSLLARWVLANV